MSPSDWIISSCSGKTKKCLKPPASLALKGLLFVFLPEGRRLFAAGVFCVFFFWGGGWGRQRKKFGVLKDIYIYIGSTPHQDSSHHQDDDSYF